MGKVTFQTPDGPRTVSIPWKTVVGIGVLIVVLLVLNSTYYSIEANEVGVVTRFGKFDRTTDPGLHFKWPWGIEDVIPVKVDYIYKEEFGFRTVEAGVRTRYAPQTRSLENEALVLTGDLNCASVTWSVQYRVKKPVEFLFKVRDPVITLRDLSESIMREVVGDRSVTDVLTSGRAEVNTEVRNELQKVLDDYDSGIEVVQVLLRDVNPPDVVKDSFNEVNRAQQEMEQNINKAWQAYNKAIPKARGDALKQISEAEGYRLERVNRAKGDAARYLSLLAEYLKAPEITRRRLYLETMGEVLPLVERRTVIDAGARSILPLLDLDGKGGAQ